MASTRTKKTKRTTKKLAHKSVSVKEGELVLVNWLDACATVGWEDHREAKLDAARCLSVGWVGRSPNPETTLILYADRAHPQDHEDHDSNRRLAIPAGWITGIKKVKA